MKQKVLRLMSGVLSADSGRVTAQDGFEFIKGVVKKIFFWLKKSSPKAGMKILAIELTKH